METIRILLVEDNEGDILLTREALNDAKIPLELDVVKDGEQAIAFLNKTEKYETVRSPDLVLLDVNLPKVNGHEVLQFVKGNSTLKHIPVIMLTTSSSQRDINLSYNNHANCYITKPAEANHFLAVMGAIENFWITIVKLPKN